MEFPVTTLCFSPGHGTRGYVRAVAAALGGTVTEVDLTRRTERGVARSFSRDEIVVVGVPVYYGRVPEVANLLEGLSGDQTPAVLVVSYGNRLVDDALLELADLCKLKGFLPVAAGAFVAPHTFSAKIGAGRPNGADEAAVAELAAGVRSKLAAGDRSEPDLPGSRPYRSFQRAPFFPKAGRGCSRCGVCVAICPMGAIPEDKPQDVDGDRCIRCLSCIPACPNGCRGVHNPMYPMLVRKLEGDLLKESRKSEYYL